jgi:ADP-ribose pyrophosphatase YjhB (NUDIX family)
VPAVGLGDFALALLLSALSFLQFAFSSGWITVRCECPEGPGGWQEERVNDIRWLNWARKIQALAQTGLEYAPTVYDRDRYQKLNELAAEIVASHTGLPAETVGRWFEVQPGYATPKVDVRAACFRDGRILLVQEKSDGAWCLPGGWADVGDRPAEAAVRETIEESGFECEARKLIGIFDANRTAGSLPLFHAFKVIFLCEIIGGEPDPDHEILAVDFFPRDGIPVLSANRTELRHLVECFAHLDCPDRPAAFD